MSGSLPGRGRASPKSMTAQRPGASLSGSQRELGVAGGGVALLNARGRLCRVHPGPFDPESPSTSPAQRPGASLSGSRNRDPSGVSCRGLLNARGRLCRVHRTNAEAKVRKGYCSTPGGVFVGFTTAGTVVPKWNPSAQRPGASLSGSLKPGFLVRAVSGLLNARGRLCRVHPCSPRREESHGQLLNARGRLCRVHKRLRIWMAVDTCCSTPGGVFVRMVQALATSFTVS